MDICFPNKNEEEFIDVAEKLNIKELYFIYSLKNNNKSKLDQLKTKVKLYYGIIAQSHEIQKAKQISNFVIFESAEKNQHIMEKFSPNSIFNLENSTRKDRFHYRTSGLNQVLCKLATKNKITIGFSLNEILKSKKRTQLIGRIIQNLRFCKKYKCNTLFASFAHSPFELRSSSTLKALERVLGSNK